MDLEAIQSQLISSLQVDIGVFREAVDDADLCDGSFALVDDFGVVSVILTDTLSFIFCGGSTVEVLPLYCQLVANLKTAFSKGFKIVQTFILVIVQLEDFEIMINLFMYFKLRVFLAREFRQNRIDQLLLHLFSIIKF